MNPTFLPLIALAFPSSAPTVVLPVSDEALRLSAHYSAVVDELIAADTTGLSDVQRAARAQLVGALQAYRDRADFGRGPDIDARVPYFVDPEGRRCAVAELLHVSGELGIVERVRTNDNHAWILDLAGDVAFEGWLRDHGLAFDEAARIQGPVVPTAPPPGSANTGFTPGTGPRTPNDGGTWRGPGDTSSPAGSGPATGTPSSGGARPSTGGPVSGGSVRGPSTGGGANTGSVPTAVNLATSTDDGWWMWWEYSKLEFLVPNRLSLANTPMTGGDAAGVLRDAIERARRAELPRFTAATSAPDATVRGAAAVALGQSAGRDAVEPLLRLLDDPSQDVRHRAILALGSTGAPSAALPLLRIARTGTSRDGGAKISPYARPMAIVALALARRAGLAEPLDTAVAAIVREDRSSSDESVALAAMFHHVLAPGESLEALALELALDDDRSPNVRCRAIEALGTTDDAKTLSKLQTLLSGPRLDLRRSAAIALGATGDARVLPALQLAHELEAEGLTKGFVLIAIGRIGGAKAHEYLAKVLEQGENGQRRWAALALGVLARDTNDPETSKRLRAAWAREKNAEARGAYWLACGLIRDESAVADLAKELAGAADARQRMYAATALSLVGGERSAAILRERLPKETNPMARVGIAQALGILGENQDVTSMRSALDDLAEPGLQAIAATALAFHGTPEALDELGRLAQGDNGPRVRRAASIEGLGLMLSRTQPLALSDVSRRMNYTVMPEWAQEMFQILL